MNTGYLESKKNGPEAQRMYYYWYILCVILIP